LNRLLSKLALGRKIDDSRADSSANFESIFRKKILIDEKRL